MDVKLLSHQYDFLTCSSKYNLLLGGVGSGKTYAGCMNVIKMVGLYPNALGFIGANTHKQLINSTLSALFKVLAELHVDFKFNQNKGILEFCGAKILCSSLENYDSLRGVELGWAWLDEAAYSRQEAFEMLMGRMRDKNGPLSVFISTTPKGYNWLFQYFHESGELHTKDFKYHKSKTENNRHLPDGYVKALREQYDDKMASQELDGEFVNITSGNIYYGFSRDTSINPCSYKPGFPIHIGMDFNVNPMTAVVGQVIGDKLYVFDEFFLRNSNTTDMANKIRGKYGNHGITVVPDSTGNKTTTNSAKSDHKILKDAGFKVSSATNPFRIDRYAAVNVSFDKGRIIIDPKCSNLIRDLERVTYKEGTNKPDTTDSSLTHISDALGYLVYRTINPFKTDVSKLVIGRY